MMSPNILIVFIILVLAVSSFQPSQPFPSRTASSTFRQSSQTFAKKPKKKKGAGGGGFGAAPTKSKVVSTISADKVSLEKQWDRFAYITDLEIRPLSEEDEFFEVVDVFVRCNVQGDDKWFRIGKACITDHGDINAALTLQKGLIFWTAVHMRRELVAAGGKSGAASLELGYMPATMNVGSDEDGPLDEDDAEYISLAKKVSVRDVSIKSIGFRPDWNPPGFTYKRREKAAMKKKKTTMEEIVSIEE